MGLFDYYEPSGPCDCPVCGTHLSEWQGKDGECALFVWRQGIAAPVEQRVDDDIACLPAVREQERLPTKFLIYSYDCDCPFSIDAECAAPDGTWTEMQIVTADTLEQGLMTRKDYRARLRWLQSGK